MHSLVRQSPVSFDAAASLTHGHYVLELHGSSPGRSGAQGGGSSSTAAGEVVFATDHLWFPPPGNVQPQVFNDTVLMNGLQHLIQRTAAGGKDRSSDGGGSGGGGSSGGGSGSSAEQPRVALIATAALTNVALLLALYPEVKDMIEVSVPGASCVLSNRWSYSTKSGVPQAEQADCCSGTDWSAPAPCRRRS